jgi:SAM-dependent methyltransferase
MSTQKESLVERYYTRQGRKISVPEETVAYNLGAGNTRYEGVRGVDLFQGKGVDIVHNINVTPWPIPDSSADIMFAFQAFEHFADLTEVMREVHRIGKHGARLIVEVPYFRHVGAFQDPTHVHFFTAHTMGYFHETEKRARGAYTDMHFRSIGFWYGWPAKSKNPLVRMWKAYIVRHKKWFDSSVWSILFPPAILVYELEVVKDASATCAHF